MLAVSQNFKDAIESETRIIKARIVIKGVTYTNSDIFHVEYNGGSITGETFNIGSTFSNNIKITFSSIIEGLLLDDQIKLEFGVVLADSTIEYVKMGTFFITSYDPQRNDYKTVIEASDKMIQLNSIYKSKLTYPARIKDVAIEIANLAGVQVNTTSFARINTSLISQLQGYTFRQAIGLIAQFECGYALFDRNGLLDIRMLSDPEYAVNPSGYFSKGLTKNEVKYTIGGISCKVAQKKDDSSETTILQSGSTSGAQVSLENNVMTQALLDAMYQKIRTVNYFPFTLNWRGNPALEAGDWITVVDLKGTRLKVPNLNYKLSFSGGLKAVSSANTQTVSSSSYQYKGPLKQQLDELSGRIGAAGNHVYDGNSEPKSPKEGDLWFKPNGPDTEIWKYQDGKWAFQISTAVNPEIQKSVDKAKQDASDAKTSANTAVDKATQASNKAENSSAIANQAKSDAANAVSNAQSAKTDATNALSNAQTAIDNVNNLKIGGRNLLLNTSDPRSVFGGGNIGFTYYDNEKYLFSRSTLSKLGIKTGDKLYFSADVSFSGSNFSGEFSFWFYSNKYYKLSFYNINKEETIRVRIPITADSNQLSSSSVQAGSFAVPTTVKITIENTKLETGTTNTDWTPAPEDAISSITNLNGQIALKASKTDVDTLTGRVSSAETSITQNANDIKLKANKTDVDTVSNKVTSVESTVKVQAGQITALNTKTDGQSTQISSLQSSYNGLQSTVANVQNDVSNIDVGGVNLLVDSDVNGLGKVNAAYNRYFSDTNNSAVTSIGYKKVSDSITPSGYVVEATSVGGGRTGRRLAFYNGAGSPPLVKGQTYTMSCYARVISGSTRIPFQYGNSTDSYNTTYVEVTSTAWKQYSWTFLYEFSNPSTVYVGGAAGAWAGTLQTCGFKLEKGTKATAWSLALEETATVTQFTSLSQTVDSIQLTVSNKAEQSQVTQLSNQISSLVTTKADKSQITQLSDQINLKVSKGDVTSQINVESGRTLIDTKLLLLSADTVKFTGSAFIPDAMIQSLTADKITAGTINAANVNVINLNASNMSTGTINGSNLSMNLNNGEVSFQKGRLFSEKMEINITYGSITQKQFFGVLELNEGVYRYKKNGGGQTQMAPFMRNNWIGFGFEANRTDGGSGTNYMSLSDNFYVDAESVFKKKVYVNNDLSFDRLTSSYGGAFRVKERDTYISSLTLETNSITVDTQYDSLDILDKRSSSSWYKSVSAKAFNTKSLKELKTDIHKLNFNSIDEIEKTDIVSFRYINDKKKKTIGGIIGDGYNISQNILSADKTSVDLYSMVSIAWDAIKQQQKQIKRLEKTVKGETWQQSQSKRNKN